MSFGSRIDHIILSQLSAWREWPLSSLITTAKLLAAHTELSIGTYSPKKRLERHMKTHFLSPTQKVGRKYHIAAILALEVEILSKGRRPCASPGGR